jgi:YHYH protein
MHGSRRILVPLAALLAVSVAGACGSSSSSGASDKTTATTPTASASVNLHKLVLGDKRYVTNGPKKGYVYSCQTQFNGGGAFRQGPWIDGTTWDATQKISVQGSVRHSSVFRRSLTSSSETLAGNGLPPHTTGVFPIASSDPAYQYDRNPNSIKSYTLRASLPRNPTRRNSAQCVGGTVGVMSTGIPLYSAFDAGGRDAVANEVQDRCAGHPQISGQYHYHSLSPCLADTGSKTSHSKLLGWALDGFGIYGYRGVGGEVMTSAKLDACHGHTHVITWNGKRVRMYHYHATRDFPYVISCYRGRAITSATGLGIGGGGPQGEPGSGPPGGGPPGGGPPPGQ